MSMKELLAFLANWLTPNWRKRQQIRPLIQQYNHLCRLRNRAYNGGLKLPELVDDLQQQNGPSLDNTRNFILKAIDCLLTEENYVEMIRENELRILKREARLAYEETFEETQSDDLAKEAFNKIITMKGNVL